MDIIGTSFRKNTFSTQTKYQRRLCLRINNVEFKEGEPELGEDCLKKVKKIFNEFISENP